MTPLAIGRLPQLPISLTSVEWSGERTAGDRLAQESVPPTASSFRLAAAYAALGSAPALGLFPPPGSRAPAGAPVRSVVPWVGFAVPHTVFLLSSLS
jgi:hypothetical protein